MQLPLTEPQAPSSEGQARDAALQQVEQAANAVWKDIAYSALDRLARTQRPFTADDLTDLMASRYVLPPTTHNLKALGGVLAVAKKNGLIRMTGEYQASRRPGCHATRRGVWIGVGE